jgi:uncharacterized protein (TIGR00369 family)
MCFLSSFEYLLPVLRSVFESVIEAGMLRNSFTARKGGVPPILLDAAAVQELILAGLPIARDMGTRVFRVGYQVGSKTPCASVYMPYLASNLRPGGTQSGPAMFTLVDGAMFAVTLALTANPLAVTSHINIQFLAKPRAEHALIGEARTIRLSRRTHVMQCDVFSVPTAAAEKALLKQGGDLSLIETTMQAGGSDSDDVVHVAHATGTYSIPTK